MEIFFPTTLQLFLNLEYESVSLVDLIGHRRTENYLRQAEQHIANQQYKGAICSVSIAFAIFQRFVERKRERERFNFGIPSGIFSEFDKFYELKSVIGIIEEKVKETFEKQQKDIDILMYGINLSDYKRFQSFAFRISISDSGNFWIDYPSHYREQDMNYENALFCYRFVIDAAFSMKQNELPPSHWHSIRDDLPKVFRVIKKVTILDDHNSVANVIREVEVGETIQCACYDQTDNYIRVFQHGKAYINKDAVKEVPSSKTFRVLKKADIIVYPSEKIEIIREADVGELLEGGGNHKGYITIHQDEEDAYINKDAVEEILPEF